MQRCSHRTLTLSGRVCDAILSNVFVNDVYNDFTLQDQGQGQGQGQETAGAGAGAGTGMCTGWWERPLVSLFAVPGCLSVCSRFNYTCKQQQVLC